MVDEHEQMVGTVSEAEALTESVEEVATLGWHRRLFTHLPGAQFAKYIGVGIANTMFGYLSFVVVLTILSLSIPPRFMYLSVILASLVSTPINITFAFFGYKLFVFRTKGNYLREWLKCFAVYGTGMLPGLLVLSALTKLLQATIHRHTNSLHSALATAELHLTGSPLHWVQHLAVGSAVAGYIAGALVMVFTTIISFIGHQKVTFKPSSTASH